MMDSNGPPGSLAAEAESSDAASVRPVNGDSNAINGRPGPTYTTSRSAVPSASRSTGTLSGTHSLTVSRSPSTAASPISSRDASPAGRSFRQQNVPGAPSGMRSRKDSHDASPHRPPSVTGHTSTIPSAAAIQRALSAATTPQLQPAPASEPTSKLPRSQRVSVGGLSGDSSPSWPVSPRLKSPPPTGSRRNSLRTQRRPDALSHAPNIIIQNPTPPTSSEQIPPVESQGDSETRALVSSKAPNRGASGAPTLETVQETSGPTTPGDCLDAGPSAEGKYFDPPSEEERLLPSGQSTPPRSKPNSAKAGDSGSDTGAKDQEIDPDSTPRPKAVASKGSFSSLKPKSGVEPSTKNMTVETETINSVPQAQLGPTDRVASGRTEHGGTLRAKASNDTIRPGKGRKKAARKAPSINATSASTRADIFEDRVKNAMDEATSDDSDETFVYESNPAEPPIRRSRHHSRTPSGASLVSMGDQRGSTRPNQSMLSTQKTRTMKFANAYNSAEDDAIDRQDGTIRASTARNGGSSVHHHHLGRPGRNPTGHTSILDDDNSPFPPMHQTRSLTGLPGRQTQNARMAARSMQVSNGTNRKDNGYLSYDLDAEGGDDERMPLLSGTVRTPRNTRRTPGPVRPRLPEQYPRHSRSILSRFAGCVVLLVMLLLLAFGVVGFLFAISTPLADVSIVEIQNVLASEQEIMFDLVVGAVNPNLLPINVGDMDVNVFAKSKYVGSEKWWREHGSEPFPSVVNGRRRKTRVERYGSAEENEIVRATDDDPLDPSPGPDEPEGNRQTMLLGRVDHFDTPLTFDGSFWRRHAHFSTGSLRLSKPGNHTELGGSERWERVLLHPFDLIVRGTLKYKIPIGGRAYAANVGSTVLVHPENGIGVPQDGKVKISRSLDRYRSSSLQQSSCGDSTPKAGWKDQLKKKILSALLR